MISIAVIPWCCSFQTAHLEHPFTPAPQVRPQLSAQGRALMTFTAPTIPLLLFMQSTQVMSTICLNLEGQGAKAGMWRLMCMH